MKKLILIIAILLGAGCLATLFFLQKNAPAIKDIRANPALFAFRDYPGAIALHTRLSTLFPRGMDFSEIDAFFRAAGIARSGEIQGECTQSFQFAQANFIINSRSRQLEAVQVIDRDKNDALWPDYTPDCRAPVPATSGNGAGALTPSGNAPEQPIHLPLEPIPGVE